MSKIDQNKDHLLFSFGFNCVHNFSSPLLPFGLILFFHWLQYSLIFYKMITGNNNILPNIIPFLTYLYIKIIFLVLFLLISLMVYCKNICYIIWGYSILFLQILVIQYLSTLQNYYNNTQKDNILELFIIIIIIILYSLIVIVCKILFYYPFYDNNNYLSQQTSYSILYTFIYRIILVLISNSIIIFRNNDNITKRIILLIATIFIYVLNTNNIGSYKHPTMQLAYKILYTYLLWTAFLMYIILHLSDISYLNNYSTQNIFWFCWSLSTPLIVLFTYLKYPLNSNQWKQLFLNNTSEVLINDRYLYLMCSQLRNNINSIKKSQVRKNNPIFLQLWKLIAKHNEFCNEIQCPLKNYQQIEINQMNHLQSQKLINKCLQSCHEFGFYLLEQMNYEKPNQLSLKIQMANYQFQWSQNRQKGLILYNKYFNLEQTTFHEKYCLFFLKKKIEMLDMNANYQNRSYQLVKLQQFRLNMEIMINKLSEFWYFLDDRKCNLQKLYNLTNKLYSLKMIVDQNWCRIKALKNIESYYLYSKYLIKILNDKQKGIAILEQVKKIEQSLHKKQEIQMGPQGIDENILIEDRGIILMYIDGSIQKVNLSVERMFGYNKGELQKQKINCIMPIIIANEHDKILLHYKETNKTNMMNKEQQIYGKNKDGYLILFQILIKPIQNYFNQSQQIYAMLQRNVVKKQIAFLIIDREEYISDISSKMLAIYPQLYGKGDLKKKIHIQKLIPNYQQVKQKVLIQQQTYNLTIQRSFYLTNTDKYIEKCIFNIQIEQILISNIGKVGYLIKWINNQILNNKNNLIDHKEQKQIRKQQQQQQQNNSKNKFNFFLMIQQQQQQQNKDKINKNNKNNKKLKYKGININEQLQQKSQLLQQNNNQILEILYENFKQNIINSNKNQKIQNQNNYKINYDKEIKIKRLIKGQFKQIHQISQQTEQQNQEINFENDKRKLQQWQQNNTIVKKKIKKQQLNSILQQQINNSFINYLICITIVIIILSLGINIAQYEQNVGQKTNIFKKIHQLSNLNQLKSEILYMNIFVNYFICSENRGVLMDQFQQEINILDSYLQSYQYGAEVWVKYSDGSTEKIPFGFALRKLVSQLTKLKNSNSLLKIQQSQVFFVHYNTINGLMKGYSQQQKSIIVELNRIKSNIGTTAILYLAIMSVIFLVILLIKVILLKLVLEKKARILQIFFEIPRKMCTIFQKECELFRQKISFDENNFSEINSNDSTNIQTNIDRREQFQRKKRNIVGQQKSLNWFILAIILFGFQLLLYHFAILIYSRYQQPQIQLMIQASSKIFTYQAQNALFLALINSYSINPKVLLLERNDSMQVLNMQLSHIKLLFNEYTLNLYNLAAIFDSSYKQSLNSLRYGSEKNTNQNHFNELLFQYKILIQKKYQNLKKQSYHYNQLLSTTTIQQQILKEKKYQFKLKYFHRQLIPIIESNYNTFEMQIIRNQLIILLCLCVLNCIGLVLIWLRYYLKLKQKINSIQYCINFIPIYLINNNARIIHFIQKEILLKNGE